MNILPVLKDYSEVCSVLCKQAKCIRCKENICTAAFTPKEKQAFLSTSAYALVCDLCLKDHEETSFVQCSDAETCAEFGVYIFDGSTIKVFISQAASLLSMNPLDAHVQKHQFTVGTIMSVYDALTAFLTWDRIRRSQSTLPPPPLLKPMAVVPKKDNTVRIPEDDWEQQQMRNQRQNYEVLRKNMAVQPPRWGDQTPAASAWGAAAPETSYTFMPEQKFAWGPPPPPPPPKPSDSEGGTKRSPFLSDLSPSYMSHSTSMKKNKK